MSSAIRVLSCSLFFLHHFNTYLLGLVAKVAHANHGVTTRVHINAVNKPFVLQVSIPLFLIPLSLLV